MTAIEFIKQNGDDFEIRPDLFVFREDELAIFLNDFAIQKLTEMLESKQPEV